jgi:hypothetical protein
MGDVLDVLSSGIAKTSTSKSTPEPRHCGTETSAESIRELLTEKMLADRWVCSVARLQRWRTVGEGGPAVLEDRGEGLVPAQRH